MFTIAFVVAASREVNQYFAISSEKQRCLADVINLLDVDRRAVSQFSFILRAHMVL